MRRTGCEASESQRGEASAQLQVLLLMRRRSAGKAAAGGAGEGAPGVDYDLAKLIADQAVAKLEKKMMEEVHRAR